MRALEWPGAAMGFSIIAQALLVWALAGLEIDRSQTAAAGQANLVALRPYWLASAMGWSALTVLWWSLLRRDSKEDESSAGPHPLWGTAALVLGIAMLVRIAVLFTHTPSLSDDIHRYIFDGRNSANGVNPYLATPHERVAAINAGEAPRWPGERELAASINNGELHTIYLPTSQYVSQWAGWLMGSREMTIDGAGRLMRAVFVTCEMLAMVCILLVLIARRRSPYWLALYAWHPLAITEIAGSGHQDAIGLMLLAAGLAVCVLSSRREHAIDPSGERSAVGTAMWSALLAIGALVKPVTIPIAALALRGKPRSHWLIAGIPGLLICTALAAPLLLSHDVQPLENLRTTADRFTNKWSHFGSVYEPVLAAEKLIWPIEDEQVQWQRKEALEAAARYVCGGVVLLVFIVLMIRPKRDALAGSIALLLAMVLCSPTAHPWYLLWALVLMPAVPSGALWIASLTLPWGYAALGDAVQWDAPAWVMTLAYAPIYTALLLQLKRRRNADAR